MIKYKTMEYQVQGDRVTNGYTNGHYTTTTNEKCGDLLDVPVLIVGGGPSGLLQSYLLSQLGIQNLVIERYPERLGAPKAHALSPRSLEICRQFGLDVRAIRQLGTKRQDAYWVNFLTTLSGQPVGDLPYERMDVDVLDATPEMIHNIPQPVFEQFVADHLLKASNADIRKGVSFVSLEQMSDEVITTVEERATGHTYKIRSRFVIACDGARSKVREHLGIGSDGEDSYETMMTIHFNADLRPVVGNRVGMLHWIFDPVAAGFIIAYDLSNNAVLISNFDSEKYPVESWSEEICRNVLKGAIGKDIGPKILSYRPWLLSRKVAKSYHSGNVFLAGDAAHSFPPTGGLGLNSGLADVHNLAFKIAAVLRGQASPSLLDTYEFDRRHVAEVNSRQSVKNGNKIFTLLKALGTAGLTDLDEARVRLFEALKDPSKQQQIAEAIEQQREHFDNLNLHIGYIYGDTTIPEHASRYQPQFLSGARLPHAWIEVTDSSVVHRLAPVDLTYISEMSRCDTAARQYSTLDICAPNAFTFILSDNSKRLYDEVVSAIRICEANALNFNVYKLTADFNLISTPASEDWIKNSGIESGGGLLIRPDQHILLPMSSGITSEDLLKALSNFLGQNYQ